MLSGETKRNRPCHKHRIQKDNKGFAVSILLGNDDINSSNHL